MPDETAVATEERPEGAAEARAFPEPDDDLDLGRPEPGPEDAEERPAPPAGELDLPRVLVLGLVMLAVLALGVAGFSFWKTQTLSGSVATLTGSVESLTGTVRDLGFQVDGKADAEAFSNLQALVSGPGGIREAVSNLQTAIGKKADAEGVSRLGSSVFTLRKRVDALPKEVENIARRVAAEAAADSAAHAAAHKRLALAVPAARAVSAAHDSLNLVSAVGGHDRRLSSLEVSMNRLEGLPHLQKLLREQTEAVDKARLKAERAQLEAAKKAEKARLKAEREAAKQAARRARAGR